MAPFATAAYDTTGRCPTAGFTNNCNARLTGVVPQTNLLLQDVLPCQTAANAASHITVISGPVTSPSPNPPITAAGNCGTTPDTRSTVTFPTQSATWSEGGGK